MIMMSMLICMDTAYSYKQRKLKIATIYDMTFSLLDNLLYQAFIIHSYTWVPRGCSNSRSNK